MKKKVSLLFFILIVLCTSISAKATNSKIDSLKKHDDRNIFFKKDSFNLDENAYMKLKGYYEYINKGINNKLYIVITPWSCIDEIKKNPMLGLMRAKVIIDFYEKNYNIERTSILIKDELHSDDSFWESFCGENPFVTFDASIPMYIKRK